MKGYEFFTLVLVVIFKLGMVGSGVVLVMQGEKLMGYACILSGLWLGRFKTGGGDK